MQEGQSELELVVRFCREGLELATAGKHDEAIADYFAAWELLPDPREEQETAAWILAAIGDILYRRQGFSLALECFERALRCPGGSQNPFVQMRLGQVYLHLEKPERARAALELARKIGGEVVFRGEDPRWLNWLKGAPKTTLDQMEMEPIPVVTEEPEKSPDSTSGTLS